MDRSQIEQLYDKKISTDILSINFDEAIYSQSGWDDSDLDCFDDGDVITYFDNKYKIGIVEIDNKHFIKENKIIKAEIKIGHEVDLYFDYMYTICEDILIFIIYNHEGNDKIDGWGRIFKNERSTVNKILGGSVWQPFHAPCGILEMYKWIYIHKIPNANGIGNIRKIQKLNLSERNIYSKIDLINMDIKPACVKIKNAMVPILEEIDTNKYVYYKNNLDKYISQRRDKK